jgi:pectate lyase-like protein
MIEESSSRPTDTRRSLLGRGAIGLGAVGAGLIAAEGPAGAQISEPWVRRDRMPANVKDYGAKADGSDDSAAFTAALQAADGGTVFVPRGTYTIGDVSFTSV